MNKQNKIDLILNTTFLFIFFIIFFTSYKFIQIHRSILYLFQIIFRNILKNQKNVI